MQGEMADLRQRHCPIITPTLVCLKWPKLASLLWSHCQSECKITSKNKISHKVKLLTCDLMWKIFTPFLAPVNICWCRLLLPIGIQLDSRKRIAAGLAWSVLKPPMHWCK